MRKITDKEMAELSCRIAEALGGKRSVDSICPIEAMNEMPVKMRRNYEKAGKDALDYVLEILGAKKFEATNDKQ